MLHSCMITGSSARGSSCEMSHADRSCCSQEALFTLPYKTRHMPSSAVQRKKRCTSISVYLLMPPLSGNEQIQGSPGANIGVGFLFFSSCDRKIGRYAQKLTLTAPNPFLCNSKTRLHNQIIFVTYVLLQSIA